MIALSSDGVLEPTENLNVLLISEDDDVILSPDTATLSIVDSNC